MTTYLPARDSTGRKVHVLSTVRFRPTTAHNPVVGTVSAISRGQLTIEYVVTEEVIVVDGQPTSRLRALDQPRQETIKLPASEVTLWG